MNPDAQEGGPSPNPRDDRLDNLAERRYFPLLLLAMLIFFSFALQGSRGLYEPDEGRYANVAMEMIRLNDYLVPHRHRKSAHMTKPPLAYWAIAGSVTAFGRKEWAVRFPHALSFFLTVIAIYGLGRVFAQERPWLPALIYATSLLPIVASNIASTDSILTFFETLACYFFALYWWNGEGRRKRWSVIAMWGAFGLAFLTKGPPGILPIFAIVLFILLSGEKRALRPIFHPVGLILFALTGLSWFIIVTIKSPHLLTYFLKNELYNRIFTASHHHYANWYGGFQIYIPTLILGTLPWTLSLMKRAYPAMKSLKRTIDGKWRHNSQKTFFLICWFFIPLTVFFIARSRLILYPLPLFVPISILLARQFGKLTNRTLYLIFGWCALILVLRGTSAIIPHNKDSRAFARHIQSTLPFRPSEVAFLSTKPGYGLGFYLDLEVEHVGLKEGRPRFDEDLDHKLAEGDEEVLWVAKSADLKRMAQELSNRDIKIVPLGSYGRFTYFSIDAGAGATSPEDF